MDIVTKGGSSQFHCVMAELCSLEVKIDALMLVLEDRGILSERLFLGKLVEAAKIGQIRAASIRQQLEAAMGGAAVTGKNVPASSEKPPPEKTKLVPV